MRSVTPPVVFALLLCLLIGLAGCDVLTGDTKKDEVGDDPFMESLSGKFVEAESKLAKRLKAHVQSTKAQNWTIDWGALKLITMKLGSVEGKVKAVVAPLKEAATSDVAELQNGNSGRQLEDDGSQLVYLPSLEKSFLVESYKNKTNSREGVIRFTTSKERFTYETVEGWPVRQVGGEADLIEDYRATSGSALPEDEVRKKVDCLDCPGGTGECYSNAKDACGTDGDCELLCDALDWVGNSCSISIAAACFYINNDGQ